MDKTNDMEGYYPYLRVVNITNFVNVNLELPVFLILLVVIQNKEYGIDIL